MLRSSSPLVPFRIPGQQPPVPDSNIYVNRNEVPFAIAPNQSKTFNILTLDVQPYNPNPGPQLGQPSGPIIEEIQVEKDGKEFAKYPEAPFNNINLD